MIITDVRLLITIKKVIMEKTNTSFQKISKNELAHISFQISKKKKQ